MSDQHAAPADHHMVGPHEAADDHGDAHGHDDHAHGGGEALGPFDVAAWSAAAMGIGLGLVVVIALLLSLS